MYHGHSVWSHSERPEDTALDRILRLVTQRAGWVLIAVFGLTVFAASRVVDFRSGEPRLFLDPSVNSLLPVEDEGREYY